MGSRNFPLQTELLICGLIFVHLSLWAISARHLSWPHFSFRICIDDIFALMNSCVFAMLASALVGCIYLPGRLLLSSVLPW